MQVTELPARIDIDRLARGRHDFAGPLPAVALPRLEASGAHPDSASASLSIDTSGGLPRLEGRCQASLNVTCERCLGPLAIDIEGDFERVVVDRIEAADTLEPPEAVVVAPAGRLDLLALLEDELLLAMPVVPRHASDDCDGGVRWFGPAGAAPPRRDNPFTVLESLKSHDSGEAH